MGLHQITHRCNLPYGALLVFELSNREECRLIYRKLLLELGNQTIARTINIEMGPENNPGFSVFVEDIACTANVVFGPAVGFYGPKWHRTKVEAISTAQGLVQTSRPQGFVVAA
jgi:hypothetical protein